MTNLDTDRLRARLRAALLLPFMAVSCSATPEPGGACGIPASWCGEVDIVAPRASGTETALGCPASLTPAPDPNSAVKEGPPAYVAPKLGVDETNARRAKGESSVCCYEWLDACPGGRPLLDDDGHAVVAAVQQGDDWAAASVDAPALPRDAVLRRALARAWTEDARAEHASIASFARATIELLALGAPPDLVAGCQRAALDEVRHAEQCFAMASAYAGRPIQPGRLPAAAPRAAALPRLARDTFLEGCVGETIAALAATRALAPCRDDRVAAVLSGIATDEAEHAALAWATVAWALRAGGAPVARALRAAARTLGDESRREPRSSARRALSEQLARHGRLDAAALQQTRRDAWTSILLPLLEDLLGAT